MIKRRIKGESMTEKDKEKDDYFPKKNTSLLKSIGGLVAFSTILPLNTHSTIEEMAKVTWFWPIISGFVGLIALAIAYILNFLIFPYFFTATIIYSFFILFNGFHHLDGLMDIGDALMAHGSPEKKIAIMRDSMIGTGGIGLFFIVAIITIASLASIIAIDQITILSLSPIIMIGPMATIVICEMSGKLGLLSCCLTSKPGLDGTGKHFISSINPLNFLFISIITLIIGYILAGMVGIIGVVGGIFGGALISLIGKRNFTIATGDVLGASNEVGRLFSLIFMLIMAIMIYIA